MGCVEVKQKHPKPSKVETKKSETVLYRFERKKNIRRLHGTVLTKEFVYHTLSPTYRLEKTLHKKHLPKQSHGRWELRGEFFEVHLGYKNNRCGPLVDTIVQGLKGWNTDELDSVAHALVSALVARDMASHHPQTLTNSRATVTQQIDWPPSLPTPTDLAEQTLVPLLLPGVTFPGTKKSLIRDLRAVPLDWEHLPQSRRDTIQRSCFSLNVHLRQAWALRKHIYRSATPWKFQGKEAEALVKADGLESDVETYLTLHGVAFETQQQQQQHGFREAGLSTGPTPDFRILSHLLINGSPVRWIEVKNFYAAGMTDENQAEGADH